MGNRQRPECQEPEALLCTKYFLEPPSQYSWLLSEVDTV